MREIIVLSYLTERELVIIKDSCVIAPNHDVTGIYGNYVIPDSEALQGPTKTYRLNLSESEEGYLDKTIQRMVE